MGRTRIKRSEGSRIGGDGGGEEGDPEVFDDLDFYQALLRDIIDGRTGADGKSTPSSSFFS